MQLNVTDLTPQQTQALELLMTGQSTGNVARALGIHRQTLWRWKNLPAFQALQSELAEGHRQELREQMGEMLRLCMLSVTRELKLAEDDKMRNNYDLAVKVLRTVRPAAYQRPIAQFPAPTIIEQPMN